MIKMAKNIKHKNLNMAFINLKLKVKVNEIHISNEFEQFSSRSSFDRT